MDQEVPLMRAPPYWSGYYTLGERYRLAPGVIFVFGSNLKGIHGAGAAAFAAKRFGAQFGVGEGFTGRSYAIPTKQTPKLSLPLETIKEKIDIFKSHADLADLSSFPEDQRWFYVTPVGTGLAGYTDEQIAPLFQGATNCMFPHTWKPYLGEYPGIRKEYHEEFSKKALMVDLPVNY